MFVVLIRVLAVSPHIGLSVVSSVVPDSSSDGSPQIPTSVKWLFSDKLSTAPPDRYDESIDPISIALKKSSEKLHKSINDKEARVRQLDENGYTSTITSIGGMELSVAAFAVQREIKAVCDQYVKPFQNAIALIEDGFDSWIEFGFVLGWLKGKVDISGGKDSGIFRGRDVETKKTQEADVEEKNLEDSSDDEGEESKMSRKISTEERAGIIEATSDLHGEVERIFFQHKEDLMGTNAAMSHGLFMGNPEGKDALSYDLFCTTVLVPIFHSDIWNLQNLLAMDKVLEELVGGVIGEEIGKVEEVGKVFGGEESINAGGKGNSIASSTEESGLGLHTESSVVDSFFLETTAPSGRRITEDATGEVLHHPQPMRHDDQATGHKSHTLTLDEDTEAKVPYEAHLTQLKTELQSNLKEFAILSVLRVKWIRLILRKTIFSVIKRAFTFFAFTKGGIGEDDLFPGKLQKEKTGDSILLKEIRKNAIARVHDWIRVWEGDKYKDKGAVTKVTQGWKDCIKSFVDSVVGNLDSRVMELFGQLQGIVTIVESSPRNQQKPPSLCPPVSPTSPPAALSPRISPTFFDHCVYDQLILFRDLTAIHSVFGQGSNSILVSDKIKGVMYGYISIDENEELERLLGIGTGSALTAVSAGVSGSEGAGATTPTLDTNIPGDLFLQRWDPNLTERLLQKGTELNQQMQQYTPPASPTTISISSPSTISIAAVVKPVVKPSVTTEDTIPARVTAAPPVLTASTSSQSTSATTIPPSMAAYCAEIQGDEKAETHWRQHVERVAGDQLGNQSQNETKNHDEMNEDINQAKNDDHAPVSASMAESVKEGPSTSPAASTIPGGIPGGMPFISSIRRAVDLTTGQPIQTRIVKGVDLFDDIPSDIRGNQLPGVVSKASDVPPKQAPQVPPPNRAPVSPAEASTSSSSSSGQISSLPSSSMPPPSVPQSGKEVLPTASSPPSPKALPPPSTATTSSQSISSESNTGENSADNPPGLFEKLTEAKPKPKAAKESGYNWMKGAFSKPAARPRRGGSPAKASAKASSGTTRGNLSPPRRGTSPGRNRGEKESTARENSGGVGSGGGGSAPSSVLGNAGGPFAHLIAQAAGSNSTLRGSVGAKSTVTVKGTSNENEPKLTVEDCKAWGPFIQWVKKFVNDRKKIPSGSTNTLHFDSNDSENELLKYICFHTEKAEKKETKLAQMRELQAQKAISISGGAEVGADLSSVEDILQRFVLEYLLYLELPMLRAKVKGIEERIRERVKSMVWIKVKANVPGVYIELEVPMKRGGVLERGGVEGAGEAAGVASGGKGEDTLLKLLKLNDKFRKQFLGPTLREQLKYLEKTKNTLRGLEKLIATRVGILIAAAYTVRLKKKTSNSGDMPVGQSTPSNLLKEKSVADPINPFHSKIADVQNLLKGLPIVEDGTIIANDGPPVNVSFLERVRDSVAMTLKRTGVVSSCHRGRNIEKEVDVITSVVKSEIPGVKLEEFEKISTGMLMQNGESVWNEMTELINTTWQWSVQTASSSPNKPKVILGEEEIGYVNRLKVGLEWFRQEWEKRDKVISDLGKAKSGQERLENLLNFWYIMTQRSDAMSPSAIAKGAMKGEKLAIAKGQQPKTGGKDNGAQYKDKSKKSFSPQDDDAQTDDLFRLSLSSTSDIFLQKILLYPNDKNDNMLPHLRAGVVYAEIKLRNILISHQDAKTENVKPENVKEILRLIGEFHGLLEGLRPNMFSDKLANGLEESSNSNEIWSRVAYRMIRWGDYYGQIKISSTIPTEQTVPTEQTKIDTEGGKIDFSHYAKQELQQRIPGLSPQELRQLFRRPEPTSLGGQKIIDEMGETFFLDFQWGEGGHEVDESFVNTRLIKGGINEKNNFHYPIVEEITSRMLREYLLFGIRVAKGWMSWDRKDISGEDKDRVGCHVFLGICSIRWSLPRHFLRNMYYTGDGSIHRQNIFATDTNKNK